MQGSHVNVAAGVHSGLVRAMLLVGLFLVTSTPLVAGSPVSGPPVANSAGDASRLVRDLESDSFETRQLAAGKLREMSRDLQCQATLAPVVRRAFASAETSAEARLLLASLVAELKPVDPTPVPTADQLKTCVDDLESDQFAQRLAAAGQIETWLAQPRAVSPTFEHLKLRLTDATLSRETRRELDRLSTLARRAWLALDASQATLSAIDDVRLNRWLETVVRSINDATSDSVRLAVESSQQELLDRLAYEPDRVRVQAAIERRLTENGLSLDARERLESLSDWIKPAMVAEIWYRETQHVVQHMFVGEPNHVPGAANPSHFDRIDNLTAHCVSGNSLTTGDWPVGVFFPNPHPFGRESQFILVNLSTPRARMAYDVYMERPESERYRELSEQTLARWLEAKRPLTAAEMVMLERLDRPAVVQFARQYLSAVRDEALADVPLEIAEACGSRHGLLSVVLGAISEDDSASVLLEAIQRQRVTATTKDALPMASLAALCILQQSTSPDVQEKLIRIAAGAVNSTARSTVDIEATAAALLVSRMGKSPESFGLRGRADLQSQVREIMYRTVYGDDQRYRSDLVRELSQFQVPVSVFETAAARDEFRAWLRGQQSNVTADARR